MEPSPVPDWLQIFAAATAGLGGIGAAAGAGAAWKAARASERTSRDALEALAISTSPQPVVHRWANFPIDSSKPDGPVDITLRILALGDWPAADLELEVTCQPSGVRVEAKRERLEPSSSIEEMQPQTDEHGWRVKLGEVTGPWPREGERITGVVRYSDMRGISRYEHTFTSRVDLEPQGQGIQYTSSDPVPGPGQQRFMQREPERIDRWLTSMVEEETEDGRIP